MGLEVNSQPIVIKKFLGLNNKYSSLSTDTREASALQNVNITDHSVETRQGSTKKHTDPFEDQTDTTTKNITGLFQARLNGTLYQVGIGGDAFKEFTGGAWVDRTGAVVITDDDNTHWSFAKFKDTSGTNDIIIAANGVDDPIKWDGSGDADVLASPPAIFNYPTVHKNKLWVCFQDFVYYSSILDGETWDTAYDVIKFENNGEYVTGLYVYSDRLIVFQKSAIWAISGSSNRDIYVEKMVSNEGTESGHSIQEVESRRYGNILVFLGKDGTIKGFNGSKNTVDIGDPAKDTFDQMNITRRSQSVSANYTKRNQYWLAMTLGSGTTNDQILIYDYANDYFSNEEGKALSSILYHTGIKANAMATWTETYTDALITANYSGFALKQDDGQLDEGSTAITGLWQTKKVDFGTATKLKMLTDLSVVTTQRTETNATVTVITDRNSGTGTLSLVPGSALYGSGIYGTSLYGGSSTEYTRVELANTNPNDEGAIFGRWFVVQLNHNTSGEQMITNELNLGVTDLGYQPAYIE